MYLLSFLASNWAPVVAVALLAAGLGVAALVLKNLKFILGAAGVLALGFAFQAADMAGYKRRVAEDYREQVKLLQSHIDVMNQVQDIYSETFKSDQIEIQKLKELVRDTPPNTSVCLPIDAARRVRAVH